MLSPRFTIQRAPAAAESATATLNAAAFGATWSAGGANSSQMDLPGARTLASLATQQLESIHGAPVGPDSAWALSLRGANLMLGQTSPERATSGAGELHFTSAS